MDKITLYKCVASFSQEEDDQEFYYFSREMASRHIKEWKDYNAKDFLPGLYTIAIRTYSPVEITAYCITDHHVPDQRWYFTTEPIDVYFKTPKETAKEKMQEMAKKRRAALKKLTAEDKQILGLKDE